MLRKCTDEDISDEECKLLEENIVDGGLCIGLARNAVCFML